MPHLAGPRPMKDAWTAVLLGGLLLGCGGPGPQPIVDSAPTPEVAPSAATVEADRIAARHILLSWQGATAAPPTLRRTRPEARQLANQVRARLRAGEDFGALARELSDDPGSARKGGELGAFDRGAMQEDFDRAAFALHEGELSQPVESPFGYHLIQREALVEIRLRQIIAQWEGGWRSKQTRSKEEARTRIEAAQAALLAGAPPADVAKEWSDGPAGPWGGEVGWVRQGELSPALDAAAFALEPGQRSEILESAAGYHLLIREE